MQISKVQLAAALVATLGFCMHGAANAASPTGGSQMGVEEKQSPSRINLDDKETTEKTEKKPEKKTEKKAEKKSKEKKEKGAESSCKGKEGSCKGKEGSCKGKEHSCKGKETKPE